MSRFRDPKTSLEKLPLEYASPRPPRLRLWDDPKRSGQLIVLVLLCTAIGLAAVALWTLATIDSP